MRRFRSKLKKPALLLASLVAGLLIAEVALRALSIGYPLISTPDPYCGSRLQPGFTGWVGKEGGAEIHVNRAGFRDREHSRTKPPGTLRIAVLGDSYAEALQVAREDTFWSVLERELQSCPQLAGRNVEVLNFGVSGHGTAQQLLTLRHHVWDYSPDLVLLAFFSGNDVRNNARDLEPDDVRPFLTLQDGELVLDNSFREHPDFQKAQSAWVRFKVALINSSRVLQVVNEFKNRLQAGTAESGPGAEAGINAAGFLPPRSAKWAHAWDLTERILIQISQEVREHEAEFWVMTVSNGIQVHPDPSVRAAFLRSQNTDDLFYADRRLEALGRREGFSVVTLSERLQQYAEERQVYLHGFENTVWGEGHWNETGHRLAGQWVAEAICGARSGKRD